MNRYLMGLMLALASTAATADCKQDCREAYTQCSQGAGTLDDTMQCKKQYKACMQACNASGMAMAGPGATGAPEPGFWGAGKLESWKTEVVTPAPALHDISAPHSAITVASCRTE